MEFGLLGPLTATDNGVPVDIGQRRQRTLLAVLLSHANTVVSTDRIIDEMWGADPPARALESVRFHISKLRSALASALGEEGVLNVIRTHRAGYEIVVADDGLDTVRFERAVDQARDPGLPAAQTSQVLNGALALWRGSALVDFEYEDWAQPEIRRLNELRLTALETRISADLELQRGAEVVAEVSALVEEYPLRERFHALLMSALYQAGRQAEALRAYQEARRLLGTELGIEPGRELALLEEQILLQDESLSEGRVALPQGLVTFLAVRTPRRQEDRAAVHRHKAEAESALRELGGVVYASYRDETIAVFEKVTQALNAAVATLSVPASQPHLLPQVALVATDVTSAEAGYDPVPIEQVLSLASVARPGQALLSDVTAQLIETPEGSALTRIGTFDYDGAGGAGFVHALEHPDLVSCDPPRLTRHTLPVEATSFVGRAMELASVVNLVGKHPLVSIVGPGGCGKTRLAIRAAASVTRSFRDGVVFVDLSVLRPGDDVSATVAVSCDLRLPPNPTTDDLVAAFRRMQMLIVIDNCEHVIDSVAGLVAAILREAPDVEFLCTSRERLRIGGEVSYPLSGLDVPEVRDEASLRSGRWGSVELFLERARLANPDWEPTGPEWAAVADICARVDGLPLAIELAVGCLRLMTVGAIERSIGDSLSLLAGGDRVVLPRHQTLVGAIDWSYQLLDEEEQRLFERLSVFHGGFSLDAAVEVCRSGDLDEVAITAILRALLDKSLVVNLGEVGGERRFALLATIRRFAADALRSRVVDSPLDSAHANWIAGLADRLEHSLNEAQEAEVLRVLDAEEDNLRQAMTWAADSGQPGLVQHTMARLKNYLMGRDHLQGEALSWLLRALDAPDAASPEIEAEANGVASLLTWSLGDAKGAVPLGRRAVEIVSKLDDPVLEHQTRIDFGLVLFHAGLIDEARIELTAGLEIARTLDSPQTVAMALAMLAGCGQPDEQQRLLDEAAEAIENTDWKTGSAFVGLQRAWFLLWRGELQEASDSFELAAALWGDLGNVSAWAEASWGLADVMICRGDRSGALALLDEVGQRVIELQWETGRVLTECRVASLRTALGQGVGTQHLERLARSQPAADSAHIEARCLGLMAESLLGEHDFGRAATLARRSAALWAQLGRDWAAAWSSAVAWLACEGTGEPSPRVKAIETHRPIPIDGVFCPDAGGLNERAQALAVFARLGGDADLVDTLALSLPDSNS